jgi:hypothetical protein
MYLPAAGAGAKQEEIEDRCYAAHVQNDNVTGLVVLGDVGTLDNEIKRDR